MGIYVCEAKAARKEAGVFHVPPCFTSGAARLSAERWSWAGGKPAPPRGEQ